jgi:spore cortex formation protein SpoVR/YcgB (stage V sporulation)
MCISIRRFLLKNSFSRNFLKKIYQNSLKIQNKIVQTDDVGNYPKISLWMLRRKITSAIQLSHTSLNVSLAISTLHSVFKNKKIWGKNVVLPISHDRKWIILRWLPQWEDTWMMKFHPEKCNVVSISKKFYTTTH